jgi:hypothetical protein
VEKLIFIRCQIVDSATDLEKIRIQEVHKYDGLNNLCNLETDLKFLNLTRRSRSIRKKKNYKKKTLGCLLTLLQKISPTSPITKLLKTKTELPPPIFADKGLGFHLKHRTSRKTNSI